METIKLCLVKNCRFNTSHITADHVCGKCMSSFLQRVGSTTASDGIHIYVTSSSGIGLAKIGLGVNGSLAAVVQVSNTKLAAGRIALCGNVLLHQPLATTSSTLFCQRLSTHSLLQVSSLLYPEDYIKVGETTSDVLSFLLSIMIELPIGK